MNRLTTNRRLQVTPTGFHTSDERELWSVAVDRLALLIRDPASLIQSVSGPAACVRSSFSCGFIDWRDITSFHHILTDAERCRGIRSGSPQSEARSAAEQPAQKKKNLALLRCAEKNPNQREIYFYVHILLKGSTPRTHFFCIELHHK